MPASSASQVGPDLFWKTAVLHSHRVASPPELDLHDQDLNTRHAGTVKYLLVGDSDLPENAQEPEVELVQFVDVSAVVCPGLAAIQQGSEDYSFIDSKLRCVGNTALTTNSAPKCAAGLGQSAGDFGVKTTHTFLIH